MYALLRLLFILLFLAACGTVAVNSFITVPEGHIAILKDRVAGIQKPALKPGSHYIWNAWVPEVYKIYYIKLKPDDLQVNFKKGLQYSDYLDLPDAFRVQLTLNITYRLNEEIAYKLLESMSEDLPEWVTIIQERVNLFLELKFYELYDDDTSIAEMPAAFGEYLRPKEDESGFATDWKNAFSAEKIPLVKWRVKKVYVPDAEIYAEQTSNVDEVFAAKREAMVGKILSETDLHKAKKSNDLEIDKAKLFAELIKKNPKLLQYLKVEKLAKGARSVFIESLGKSEGGNANAEVQAALDRISEKLDKLEEKEKAQSKATKQN